MSMQDDPDATMPVPGAGEPFPGGEPTQPVTRPGFGGPGEPPPGGGDWEGDDEGGNRRLWMIAGAVLVVGLLVGGAVAVLASGGEDDKTSDTTTTSTSTSSTTSSTLAPTTLPPTTSTPSPSVVQFTVNQNPVSCPSAQSTVNIVLTWSTQNAQSATISIDNPNGPYGTYGPSGQQQVPFTCSVPGPQHTYYLTANGAGSQKTTRELDVNGTVAPTTTTTEDGP